jgi:hypothetical protein
MRTEVRTGVSDGAWIEVASRRIPTSLLEPADEESWVAIDGSEQVIQGDLASLTDGGPVQVISKTAGNREADPEAWRSKS